MTFEYLKKKYAGNEAAFPEHFDGPNDSRIIMDLILNHNCNFPKAFIDFQLIHCHEQYWPHIKKKLLQRGHFVFCTNWKCFTKTI